MVHTKQLSYTKRLAANKIIDLIYDGKLAAAKAIIKKNYKPGSELFHFFYGWINQMEGRHDLAITSFEKALIANPLNGEVLIGLAGSYLELNDFERASECAEHAITLNGKEPKNLLTMATILSKSKLKDRSAQLEADSLFEKAFDYCVSSPEPNKKLLVDILSGWGGCLLNLEEMDQARILLEKAISYDNYNPIAHKNLVSVYANMNLIRSAIESCKIAEMSDDKSLVIDTIYQEGMLELLQGNFAKGWRLHEARLETSKFAYKDLLALGHKNLSEITEQDSLLLFQEQGIGDLLQFLHLIPEVYKLCKNIDIVVLPNTFLPMDNNKVKSPKDFIEHNLKDYVRNVYVRGVDKINTEYDCATPLMSLGYWLKLTPDNNPGILPFRASTACDKYVGRVGIFWKGSVHHANDSLRSVPTSYINELVKKNTHIDFVSLQIDRDNELVLTDNIVSAKEDMKGLLETVSVLEDCSLIITVDSMIAHLAAGMGKSVIMLHAWSPDWRWGIKNTTENRWYKTVTDIRQAQYKNWDTAFEEVNNRLEVFKMFID
jgi:tetratricopeptide (TPR) repeat protein